MAIHRNTTTSLAGETKTAAWAVSSK
jgi:hypothetical protein